MPATQLFQIQRSFRMSKSNLQAGRPATADATRSKPPDHRVRRPRGQPPDRESDRLDDPQVRRHRPPLPHHSDPGRPPLRTRFLTTFARPSKRSPRQLTSALMCANSGENVISLTAIESWGLGRKEACRCHTRRRLVHQRSGSARHRRPAVREGSPRLQPGGFSGAGPQQATGSTDRGGRPRSAPAWPAPARSGR